MDELTQLLKEWERWSADILESHLSYPVLTFYRSQHDRESWLSALTAIIDACALLPYCKPLDGRDAAWCGPIRWQAQLTFAMARHTLIDLALILNIPPSMGMSNRLSKSEWASLTGQLAEAGLLVEAGCEEALTRVRRQYEPYVIALADRLLLILPPWYAQTLTGDNWETSAWDNEHHF